MIPRKVRFGWCILLWFFAPTQLSGAADIRTFAEEFKALSLEHQEAVKEIAHELRCPTCTGLSVLESDAPFSLQMRTAVLDQVKQGRSKAEIMQFFVERYGLWILREPPRQGFHLLAWLLPCLSLILGPVTLIYLRRRRRDQPREPRHRIRSRRELVDDMQRALVHHRRHRSPAKEGH